MWQHSLRVLLVLLFLFCSFAVTEGEEMYQISESELNELEEIQKLQENRIGGLEILLNEKEKLQTEKETLLTKKEQLLMEQSETINDLEVSFDEYANEAEGMIRELRTKNVLWKVLTIVGSAVAAGSLIYIGVTQ